MTYQFGEASRLYAENFAVVCEMEKAFKEDLKQLFSQVAEAVQRGAGPRTVKGLVDGKYWYCWIGADPHLKDGQVAVWCAWGEPSIVTDRSVRLSLGAAKLDATGQAQVAALAPALSHWKPSKKRNSWSILEVDARWKPTEDPVDVVASHVVAALGAVDASMNATSKEK